MTAPNWSSVNARELNPSTSTLPPPSPRPDAPFTCSNCVVHWRAGHSARVKASSLLRLLLQLEDRLQRARNEIQALERDRARRAAA